MTDELMNLPLIPNKFIKGELFEINKNTKKACKRK